MKFRIEDDVLSIIFEGGEQFWAIKRRIVLPKVNIANVTWQEGAQIPRKELGWRIGGTAVPRFLLAGRFAGGQGKNFVYLQKPLGYFGHIQVKHVLTFELVHSSYKHMFFTVDKPDIAESIIGWWSSNI